MHGYESNKSLSCCVNVSSVPVAKEDHSQKDCFVCVILSHGGQNELTDEGERRVCDVIMCRNDIIAVRELVDCLKDEKTLVDKPKLFFIQTCRGTSLPATVESHGDGRPPKTVEPARWKEEERNLAYKLPADLPVYPEFLLAWSTVPGYYAFRHADGSPFIEYLCEGLRQRTEHDLLTILTWVQNQVAIKYTATLDLENGLRRCKQMPWVASMLTRNVHLQQ
ncbi:hypothetical protein NP493_727g01078 [Ridgeia piscesae]|uniref:Uncharacterized protein n=1 Tax=Ridgeia piscesae TaxID=27915 RepID=A0AAD9KQJ9_RIDPI|nr:hypothetical protein NP493_727g01078 [Ridgeia piscesae]